MADNSPPPAKTPKRFWLYGAVAIFVLVSTLLWMASLFSGCDFSPKEDTMEDGGRMLRPM